MLAAVLAFAGVAAVINVTPGLDTLLVLRTSVAGGRTAGLASGLGVNTGCLAWGLAAAAGVTGLLAASHSAFAAVRIAGAAYLAWLGGCALWRARRGPTRDATVGPGGPEDPDGSPRPMRATSGWLAAFRSGLTTNLLNPNSQEMVFTQVRAAKAPRA